MNKTQRRALEEWLRQVLTQHLQDLAYVVFVIHHAPVNYVPLVELLERDLNEGIERSNTGTSQLSASELAKRQVIATEVVASIRQKFLGGT